MISTLVILLLSFIYVQALVITQPDATGWPRNSGFMTVRWTTSPSDPPIFTMLLRDASELSVVNPLAVGESWFAVIQLEGLNLRMLFLAANVPSSSGSFQLNLPTVPVSQTYQLLFVDSTNLTRILTASPIFPITNSSLTASASSSSETITQKTVTVTLSAPLSTSPPGSSTTSGTPTANNTLSTPTSITRFTTSTLGTTPPGTVTVTVTPDPGSSFVPINSAERLGRTYEWVGLCAVVVLSFYLGGL
ncbi:unnamed protein product [Rhizoctonia solani]|uniref:Uncharacterized protein n=1 Tax=Rhizoctonia solani TaxID=456999 RepID=A0A8H2WU69_9AGAM|nr:unnamed protein product [Rhizoctonia solani]